MLPRFPRMQFSVRVLLALTVLAGVLLGVSRDSYKRKELAIVRLEELGAVFVYAPDASGDSHFSFKGDGISRDPPGNPWLQQALGKHFAVEIDEVWLPGVFGSGRNVTVHRGSPEKFTDADAALLTSLPTLTTVKLYETQLTDAGLMHLAALPRLKTLDVTGAGVSSYGVAKFKAARSDVNVRQVPVR